jgi:hypothetical protein
MTSDRKKPGVAFWAIVVVALVVLYIASSGPARSLLIRRQVATRPVWIEHKVNDRNWQLLYAPLIPIAREKFGKPLRRYWRQFPIPTEK